MSQNWAVFTAIFSKNRDILFQYSVGLPKDALGFMFFALDLILGLQDDEAEDAITDSSYLRQSNKASGHDRGIDALYIDTSEKPAVVHFFNMKYTEEIKNTAKISRLAK